MTMTVVEDVTATYDAFTARIGREQTRALVKADLEGFDTWSDRALIVLRARKAEETNPDTPEPRRCACIECMRWRFTHGEAS